MNRNYGAMTGEAYRQSFLGLLGLSPLSLALLTALGIAPLVISDEYILQLAISSLLLGAQAIAFDFTVGLINVVNFGFAALVGVGAYASALMVLRLGITPWLGPIGGAMTAGGLGFLVGLLTLRLQGIYAAVMTWFVGLTLLSLAASLVDLTRGYSGLNVPLFLDTASRRPYFYIIFPITVLILAVLQRVSNSQIGLAFRAIGQNTEAARASGINPTKYRIINFTLSCFFAGLLGGFYAHFLGILTPDVMHSQQTVEVLALAYVGGRGSLWGGLMAALIFVPLFEYLKPLMEIRLIIYGVLLISAMIFYPGGLAECYASLKRRRRASTST
jgi:branched-chain amino acid transport system permease protein